MAVLAEHPYDPFPDYESFSDVAEGFRAEDEAFDELLASSDALQFPDIVGGLIGWGRGDGTAWYIVTKEKPLTVAWVAYSDRWSVEPELIRGLRRDDVLGRLYGSPDGPLPKLFGQSKYKMRSA